jgi:hypothetical protein
MSRKLFMMTFALFAAFFLGACAPQATPAPEPTPQDAMEGGMDMSTMDEAPAIPAGLAYIDGQEMRFVHTEASDPDVAKLLSDMMSSPVVHVPALAEAPESLLAQVYVFKNGVKGMGPLGFQPDVFDNPPGSPGYSPLRRIVFVTWKDESKARELKALSDIVAAEAAGELTLETSGVVVNMPFVTWPGGSR